jgi:glycosyltransferase involved in cell wall biosynthesis
VKRATFIVWARYHRRSELLARHFRATIHYVHHGRSGKLFQSPVRYAVQAWRTWGLLRLERPDVIFVQNPPIFAVLVVSVYARCHGAGYVIDSHTGAFLARKWRWSIGLHRMLSRGALTTIVHNESQEKVVRRWGHPNCLVAFTPGDYPSGEPFPLSNELNIAVVCGFDPDEPLDILFEAASRLPGVRFYLTGDAKRMDPRLLRRKPGNIRLTGYLSYERYIGLLRGVSAIMDLVNNEHTLLMGGFEAVSLGVPLIVSDWPLLRSYFSRGTVYVPNTVEGICEGVSRAQRENERLRGEILILREQLQLEWTQKSTELRRLLK